MFQNGKLQILILALFIGGAWWMNKPTAAVITHAQDAEAPAAQHAKKSLPSQASVTNKPVAPQALPVVVGNQKLKNQLTNVAQSMQHPELPMPAEFMDVSHITPEDMNTLGDLALNMNVSEDMRSSALFLLTKIGYPALKSIAKVATTEIPALLGRQKPHSADAAMYESEVSLRITAIESMDSMTTHTKEIKPLLEKALQVHTDPTLSLLLNVGLGGIEEGRPGKISRAIEAMIQEKTL